MGGGRGGPKLHRRHCRELALANGLVVGLRWIRHASPKTECFGARSGSRFYRAVRSRLGTQMFSIPAKPPARP